MRLLQGISSVPAAIIMASRSSAKTSIQLLLLVILSSGFLCHETVRFVSCTSSRNASCSEIERKALFNFKQGLVDPSLRLYSWVGRDCCKWAGVKCNNKTGHVIMLNLRNEYSSPDGDENSYDYSSPDGGGTSLAGEINPSLLELKHLAYLDLSGNNFEGIAIPKFIGSLKTLRYLNLSSAFFGGTIPSSLGNLSSLQYLDLNSLTVKSNEIYLNWLSGLSSLKYLNLGSIDLGQAKTNWLQAVNMLPSLSELHLSACGLSILPPSLPPVNLTSLSVLDLSKNGFNSSIPPWLFNLSRLVYVDLSSNQLQGGVPGEFADLNFIQRIDLSENSFINGKLPRNLGKLCHLRVLDLSFNKISGEMTEFTDGLSNCTNCRLEYLHLGYNILGGNIPKSLGHLKNLKHLLLHKNPFSGSIPDSIGNLSSLEEFYLSENGMKGTIPASLGQLSSLVVLDLKNNQWEGVISEAHFSNLTSLKELSIVQSYSNITLVFNVSSEWIPPFKLKYLNLKSCLVGPKFPMWLRNQNELNYVAVWHANISDTIPDWFWKLDLFLDVLDFSYNQLNGSIPNTIKFGPDAIVFLNYNRFTGPLPVFSPNVTSFHLDNNFFTGPIPEDFGERMPMLSDVDISFNSLNGSIPLSIGNLSNLLTLVLANNQLTGKIPDFWSGLPGVYVINVANNNLTGEIPSSLGNLGSLSPIFLTLSNNQLSGEIPSALRNCTDIKTLDLGDNKLSGSIPAFIGEKFPSLLILRLRSNLFYGNIPSQLCNLSSLHILDLAHNNLSGSIPPCLGNLSGISFGAENVRYEGQLLVATKGREYLYDTGNLYLVNSIDLSSNSLRGEFPDLTNLSRLGILNLSMNHLTGKIPESIGTLKQLETLDLSINQFFGPIPTSLASSTFLSHLNLSHNNLSGKIPSTNQFQTFNDPSIYEGNTALCGSPLPNKCNEDEEASHFPNGEERDDEDKDKLENLLFYSTIVLGFLIGFWGVCGSFIMKKSWRLAYFKLVDDMKDKLILAVSLKLAHRSAEEWD